MKNSNSNARLLIVDDDIETRNFWKVALEEHGFAVQVVPGLKLMEAAIRQLLDPISSAPSFAIRPSSGSRKAGAPVVGV